ncbi:MAG: hypothetical protein ACJAUH_001532 [Saprospiraceae bacterium]|jgi:hypothetical protein
MSSKIKEYNLAINSIKHFIKPIKEKLDIDELMKVQNYQGANKIFIDALADEMEIETAIEELLEII